MKTKNPAAVELGKRRAETLDKSHQKAAANARWAGHVPCSCGKCAACYQRAYRARIKKSRTAK